MKTEVILQKMVAFEFNDAIHGDFLMCYIALMHCLIDTPDEIHVLSESIVIGQRSPMLGNRDISVTGMWKCMCNPFFTGPSGKLSSELHEVLLTMYFIH
jgi:hypothetical protein